MPVGFTARALKDAEHLPEAERVAVFREIVKMATGYAPNADVRKLQGRDEYRLRVGRWRILFQRAGKVTAILRILDRKDAYRF